MFWSLFFKALVKRLRDVVTDMKLHDLRCNMTQVFGFAVAYIAPYNFTLLYRLRDSFVTLSLKKKYSMQLILEFPYAFCSIPMRIWPIGFNSGWYMLANGWLLLLCCEE